MRQKNTEILIHTNKMDIDEAAEEIIKQLLADKIVICAFSGGVYSLVTSILVHKATG